MSEQTAMAAIRAEAERLRALWPAHSAGIPAWHPRCEGDPDPDPDPPGPDPEPLGDAGKKALETERQARKAAEKRLADLTGRVEAMQRSEVERIAAAAGDGFRPLADAADLWRADGVEMAALLGEDGAVDPAKVRATVGEIVAQRPHWGAPLPRGAGDADTGKGKGPGGEPTASEIADRVFSGA